ncbi:MAG TPA: HNH endonuclease [Gemmatimonadaceae bacterium]|nr:HNH endonuclease [Gemmatimonadaceae bacterium]
MTRDELFQRDGYRCVYCAGIFESDELTVDHVQPRVRGGDRSGGNLVTACITCNTAKGHTRVATFLAARADARENFFRYATHVWPRHLRAIEEELGPTR